jgi:hypothetical protein
LELEHPPFRWISIKELPMMAGDIAWGNRQALLRTNRSNNPFSAMELDEAQE